MSNIKDFLIGTITLSTEVERLNKSTDELAKSFIDLDKRMVRIETLIEVGQNNQSRLPDQ